MGGGRGEYKSSFLVWLMKVMSYEFWVMKTVAGSRLLVAGVLVRLLPLNSQQLVL
jgi:hypothetical protein